jgi:hypothetical protein
MKREYLVANARQLMINRSDCDVVEPTRPLLHDWHVDCRASGWWRPRGHSTHKPRVVECVPAAHATHADMPVRGAPLPVNVNVMNRRKTSEWLIEPTWQGKECN